GLWPGLTLAEATRRYIEIERSNRVCALATHYGIELNPEQIHLSIYQLLICLAESCVRGFQVNAERAKFPGRAAGSGNMDLVELAAEIAKFLDNPKMTVRAACAVLAKRKPWKDLITSEGGSPGAARALEARYKRHLQNMANPDWGTNSVEALRR